jgi:hypothetical protein
VCSAQAALGRGHVSYFPCRAPSCPFVFDLSVRE